MSRRSVVAGGLALLLVVALAVVLWPGGGTGTPGPSSSAPSVCYPGSDVRILGVKVGKVTRSRRTGDRVAVDFDVRRPLLRAGRRQGRGRVAVGRQRPVRPAHAGVHEGGRELADGARIQLADTAVPVELDRIFSSLNDLDVALGPEGANRTGALSRLLAVGADNLDGEGGKINRDAHRPSRGDRHPVRRARRPVRDGAQPAGLHHGPGRQRLARCGRSTPTWPASPTSSRASAASSRWP